MPTLSQHVCFDCRKVFKKPHFYPTPYAKDQDKKAPVYRCPDCGTSMTYMGYKFRAPKKEDVRAWKKIEDGVRTGTDWAIPTIRKQKAAPKISPALKAVLGVQKKNPNQPLQRNASTKSVSNFESPARRG
jgi:DNA-directed RNA polymerase subunit RPC12/RpoP